MVAEILGKLAKFATQLEFRKNLIVWHVNSVDRINIGVLRVLFSA